MPRLARASANARSSMSESASARSSSVNSHRGTAATRFPSHQPSTTSSGSADTIASHAAHRMIAPVMSSAVPTPPHQPSQVIPPGDSQVATPPTNNSAAPTTTARTVTWMRPATAGRSSRSSIDRSFFASLSRSIASATAAGSPAARAARTCSRRMPWVAAEPARWAKLT